MDIESSVPLTSVIPSYLYIQYSDDDNLQAFVNSFNSLSQGYLDWFNNTPLAIYTDKSMGGPLLDWTATGIYNHPRPIISNASNSLLAGYGENYYGQLAYGENEYLSSGASTLSSDDIYKRVLTWNLYRGDGRHFCIKWLKNRIARFMYGANGMDYPVIEVQPSISISNGIFTVSYYSSTIFTTLQLLYNNGSLSFPFDYSLSFVNVAFSNDGGVLAMQSAISYASTPNGPAGSVWWDGGVIAVVPGVTPDPTAAPIYFTGLSPLTLQAMGGGNLPISNPLNSGQLWNNGGVVSISSG